MSPAPRRLPLRLCSMKLQVMATRVDALLLRHPQFATPSGWSYPTLGAELDLPISPMYVRRNIGSIREDDGHYFNESSTSQRLHHQGGPSTSPILVTQICYTSSYFLAVSHSHFAHSIAFYSYYQTLAPAVHHNVKQIERALLFGSILTMDMSKVIRYE